jgi:hypothetical protein
MQYMKKLIIVTILIIIFGTLLLTEQIAIAADPPNTSG